MLKTIIPLAIACFLLLQAGCQSVQQDSTGDTGTPPAPAVEEETEEKSVSPDEPATPAKPAPEKPKRLTAAEKKQAEIRAIRILYELIIKSEDVDAGDARAILDVIGQFEAIEADFVYAGPGVREEYYDELREWTNRYFSLARIKYKKVVKAAAGKIALGDFKGAIAEMDKFPRVLGIRGPYGAAIDRRRKAIKALSTAPKEVIDTLNETDKLLKEGKVEKALEKLENYMKTVEKKSDALVLILDKHIAILDGILNRLVDSGNANEAFKTIEKWKKIYATHAHTMFLLEKRIELEEK